MALDKQLMLFLNFPALFMLVFLGFVPVLWPIFSQYEGSILPVIKNVKISETSKTDDGIIVKATFDKVRSCEFIGLSWYDSFGNRTPILYSYDDQANIPFTRPVTDKQKAGPWKLIGMDNLDGSYAIASHRCHPLWITYSRFFNGGRDEK